MTRQVTTWDRNAKFHVASSSASIQLTGFPLLYTVATRHCAYASFLSEGVFSSSAYSLLVLKFHDWIFPLTLLVLVEFHKAKNNVSSHSKQASSDLDPKVAFVRQNRLSNKRAHRSLFTWLKAVSLGVYFASAAAVRVEFDRKGKELQKELATAEAEVESQL